jgi:mono/diheme cytochrome c family protein
MVRRLGIAGAFVLGAAGMACFGAAADGPATFTKDVLPILQENCVKCHRPGGDNIAGMVAPMSLMTYEEVRPWSKAVAKAVSEKKMPPWFATPEFHGIFENERVLTEEEVQTIVSWANSGAPRGNPQDAPAPVVFEDTGGWLTGKPDLVVKMPEPYFVKDEVEDIYVNFITDPLSEADLPKDRWLRAIEWRGQSEVVHHIVGGASVKDENGDQLYYELGSIAPGEEGMLFPEGHGKLLPKGSKIHFQMHYHKESGPGTGTWDQSMVAFRFWDEEKDPKIQYAMARSGISNHTFEIPPNHGSWPVGAAMTFEEDTTIHALHPHMHLRGKDARYIAYYPDGSQEELLWVPSFDFNWQLDYTYAEPKKVPAGTRVEFTAHYDNSPDNLYNPDPTISMAWGGPTTMEMMIGYIAYCNTEPSDNPMPAARRATGEASE